MSLSKENHINVQLPIIKQNSEEARASSSMIESVRQELDTLQERAHCELSNVLISKPDGIVKCEPLPLAKTVNEPENAEHLSDSNISGASSKQAVSSIDDSLVCKQCSFVASKKIGLHFHHIYMHQSKPDRVKVKCEHCGLMIYKDRYEAHQIRIKLNLKCPQCSFTGSRGQLLAHRQQHPSHGSIYPKKNYRPYFCTVCHCRFYNSKRLKMHLLYHKNKTDFCCIRCNCYFSSALVLEKHLTNRCMKNAEKPFQCRFCDQKFFTEISLNRHERGKHHRMMSSDELATPALGLKCKCGKYLATPRRLARHRFFVHKAPKRCTLCHRSYKRLGQHVLSCRRNLPKDQLSNEPTKTDHDDINEKVKKSFKCSSCKKEFTTKNRRDSHVRKKICVKMEIDFKCDLCQKIFRSKYKRDSHEKNKTCTMKKVVYSCEICYKDFSTKWYLTKHKKSGINCHIPLADLSSDPCPGCNETFESEVFLKRHLKYCAFL